ncbi:MAG: MFS transporter [Chloroflexi bacterium]|nr:MFS transporter [Chloroflexota bacterium]
MPRIFYGWWIVAAGGLVQGYAAATFWRGFTAFFNPIVETFGWSAGATAAALSLQRTEGGMISPFVGTVIDRFGPRRVMSFGIFVTGVSIILMSQMNSLWQFYLAMSLLTVGMSFGTFIVLVTTVGNWFIQKRSRALAILMACTGIGGFTVPVLVGAIDVWGWRDVMFGVGVGFWVVGFPAMLFMRTRPEDYGQLPDGVPLEDEGTGSRTVIHEADFGVRQVLRTRFFWQFSIALSLGQLVSSTNLLHLPALSNFDVSLGLAAGVIAAVAAGDFIGRLGIGVIGDRFDKRHLIAISFMVQTVGVLALALTNAEVFGFTFPMALTLPVFAIGFGLGFGSSIPLRLSMLADYFGRRSYGSILGITSTVSAGFAAIGPIFVGVSFDILDTYRPAFLILAVILVAAVPISLTLERPERVAARIRAAGLKKRAEASRAASRDIREQVGRTGR